MDLTGLYSKLGFLANRSIGTRIWMLVGVLAAGMLLVTTVAVRGQAVVADNNAELDRAIAVRTQVEQARYDLLWASNWQNITAWKSRSEGPVAAAPDGDNLKNYADGVAGFEQLFEVDRGALGEEATAHLETIESKWAELLGYNDQIHGLWAAGKLDEGDAVSAGPKWDIYFVIAEALDGLSGSVDAQIEELRADTDAAQDSARLMTLIVTAAALFLGILLAVLLSMSIVRPMGRLREALDRLAEGDLGVEVPAYTVDELGDMTRSLNSASASLRSLVGSVADSANTVASAAEELTATAGSIEQSAVETSAQSGVVATAADEVSQNVGAAATGAEQMGMSIREIAENANRAAQVATEAVTVAAATNETVARLGDSSEEIGKIVKVITSIAEQTNLLALNATIEAARAGDAGKGFAVVAGEVKDLAQGTARATDEIVAQIAAIQEATGAAVDAIGQISGIVTSISDYQTTIASAVEEQTATTNEMSRSVADAAASSTQIAATISSVAASSESTTAAVNQTSAAIAELATMAESLRAEVARFRY